MGTHSFANRHISLQEHLILIGFEHKMSPITLSPYSVEGDIITYSALCLNANQESFGKLCFAAFSQTFLRDYFDENSDSALR